MILIGAVILIFVSVGIPVIHIYRDLCFDFDPKMSAGGGGKGDQVLKVILLGDSAVGKSK
jgi:hypothetical protein